MLFNSFEFALFYVIVTPLYFILPHRFQWVILLAASCYFYMAFVPVYILILGFTIVVDYFAGIYIEKTTGHRKKLLLILSLTANIGILVFFKYFKFLTDNLDLLLHHLNWHHPLPYLSILLPIGLSFHTFQAMSYTIEVYRGRQAAEKHFGIYALYVMFYPQLVAGPIERPQNLLHQFKERHHFNYNQVTSGLKLMAWGLFKKMVIADRLAMVVNHVYKDPENHSSLTLIIATLFFTFQIFCDFSGYSDIAIGAARTMGFTLMKNFDNPYQSGSVSEFWTRWHISLSTWFKDYLYIPLGGNRVNAARWCFNIMVVFLLSGLWHGANWTFVIWGALHGFYLIFGAITQKQRLHLSKITRLDRFTPLPVITTFTLVSFTWIFFRADNLHAALFIIQKIFAGLPGIAVQALHHKADIANIGVDRASLAFCFLAIIFLQLIHWLQSRYDLFSLFRTSPGYIRWPAYGLLVLGILSLGIFDHSQFIYFQF